METYLYNLLRDSCDVFATAFSNIDVFQAMLFKKILAHRCQLFAIRTRPERKPSTEADGKQTTMHFFFLELNAFNHRFSI